jgi:polysaccharide biosynthesis/export protein
MRYRRRHGAIARLLLVTTCITLLSQVGSAHTQEESSKKGSGTESALEATRRRAGSESESATDANRDDGFVIGSDDVLAVNVWKEPEISRVVTVRPDGKISLPLIGELQASSKTPRQVEAEIADKLSAYISEPSVTVIMQEMRSHHFNILGRVQRPGSYLISNSTTVLDALALAGGFRDFAKQKLIYILRSNADGKQVRLAFNYKDVIKGVHLEQNVKLQPRDTVIVP